MNAQEIAEEFEDVCVAMDELFEQAKNLIKEAPDRIRNRAESYWFAQIKMAISDDHSYLGSCQCTMNQTLQELHDCEEEDDE